MVIFQRKRAQLAPTSRARNESNDSQNTIGMKGAKTDKKHSGTFVTESAIEFTEKMLQDYGRQMFLKIHALACPENINEPPMLDDLTARLVNRNGGWKSICKQWPIRRYQDIELQFEGVLADLIPHKLSGFYCYDKMPASIGLQKRGVVYRLLPVQVLGALNVKMSIQGEAG